MFISMIFNLATLAIAFMAFSTSTAQQIDNGQVNIYYSSNCQGSPNIIVDGSSAGSAANSCKSACTKVAPLRDLSMQIFNTNANQLINQTTCYFYYADTTDPNFDCPPGVGGSAFAAAFRQSDQGCQVIPYNKNLKDIHLLFQTVGISCFSAECTG